MTDRIVKPTGKGVEGMPELRVPEADVHRNVTPGIVDLAVEEVFERTKVPTDLRDVVRSLMASDANSELARSYYHGVLAGPVTSTSASLARRKFKIPYVLTDEQVAALGKYAPEIDLSFSAVESHDHPMAAACRLIDRSLVDAKFRRGIKVSHVGGALVPLVLSGRLGKGHHACMPKFDKKDQMRHVLDGLRMRKISADMGQPVAVRESALGYLAGEESHVCGRKVQDCSWRTRAISSVHVYDVPIADWPAIMVSKGAELVEGCILFPRSIYSETTGEMKTADARYEVDAKLGVIRMGFRGSPAWWYEHNLVDYLKYGVDQVLCSGGPVYSYRVTERRGDTIFFRILQVSRQTEPNFRQHYLLPGIPMIQVNGFSMVSAERRMGSWTRQTYLFPKRLWEDMLGHAKECYERGTLKPEKLFSYYRTVAPRHCINAVVVAGGVAVESINDLAPLVVHVVLFAMLECRKLAREVRCVTDAEVAERDRMAESTFYKVGAAFCDALVALAGLACYPLIMLSDAVKRGVEAQMRLSEYDWGIVPVVRLVSPKLLMAGVETWDFSNVITEGEEWDSGPYDVLLAAKAEPELARFVLDSFEGVLPESMVKDFTTVANASESTKESAGRSAASVSLPVETTSTTFVGSASRTGTSAVGTGQVAVTAEEVERRKSSIAEAIMESESESKKSEASCASHYTELMVGGAPSKKKLDMRRELCANPEFWFITGGVLEKSFSGAPVEGFQHAVVYVPSPHNGSRLLPVVEERYQGLSRGHEVDRTYYKVSDSSFTGWAFTNDSLMIHNGPAIEEALKSALTGRLDFVVEMYQGPPGCGKTTQIVEAVREDDVVLVPVRKAARETAGRIADKGERFTAMSKSRVRTLDSYLVNRLRLPALKGVKSSRLLADEAYMTREGRWLAAAELLGVSVVLAYGDKQQVPHTPRAETPKFFVTLRNQTERVSHLTYRCPPELVACWGSEYDWQVRSTSLVKGDVRQVNSTAGIRPPKGCVMMGMYQADKMVLKKMYANCGEKVQVMTAHESEGNTYEHVWLHRFDYRKRTDNFSLYDKAPYVLVAMSRSTKSFLYVSPDLGDLVTKWIRRGKDPRRVSAAADVASAGRSVEFV